MSQTDRLDVDTAFYAVVPLAEDEEVTDWDHFRGEDVFSKVTGRRTFHGFAFNCEVIPGHYLGSFFAEVILHEARACCAQVTKCGTSSDWIVVAEVALRDYHEAEAVLRDFLRAARELADAVGIDMLFNRKTDYVDMNTVACSAVTTWQ